MEDLGTGEISFKTQEGKHKRVRWSNATVAMPIVGAKKWNSQTKSRAILDEAWGLLHHKPTSEEDPSICSSGVYFTEMFVNKRILSPDPSRDFGRRGDA